jgi:hypothetical protein
LLWFQDIHLGFQNERLLHICTSSPIASVLDQVLVETQLHAHYRLQS